MSFPGHRDCDLYIELVRQCDGWCYRNGTGLRVGYDIRDFIYPHFQP